MKKKYGDCFYCGGAVEEKLMPREIRWKGQLLVFENVPMGVCTQCGEKVLKPGVAKAIDQLLKGQKKPNKTIQVPVYEYESNVA
ncbi:MAG: YgiT-type zinc finger protein [Deltaproteobacteria bacterium]|nr:MAG: YgiT-type zinc finger protein [Deltaproteobacteria bacterium]